MKWAVPVVLFILSAPAHAEWQDYRWGMSYEEVKGKCKNCKEIKKEQNFPDTIKLKKTKYKIYDENFDVTFHFDENEMKLNGIQISLEDKSSPKVAGSAAVVIPLLVSKYGSPSLTDRDESNGVRQITQQWITSDNVILAYQAYYPSKSPSYFYINYYPVDRFEREKL